MMEVFSPLDNMNPEFMWSYFALKHVTISFRSRPMLKLAKTNSTGIGINSVIFRACVLWNRLLHFIKYCNSLI